MSELLVVIDAIHGDIKITVDVDDKESILEFKWCAFDDEGDSVGFLTSFTQVPILVTELAAEQLIRVIVANLVKTSGLKPGELTIINHMGEHIPDVQFLPPTFSGDETELLIFITRQDSLVRLFSFYEEHGNLDSELIDTANNEGIVDDLLNLVHLRGSGIFLTASKPNQ